MHRLLATCEQHPHLPIGRPRTVFTGRGEPRSSQCLLVERSSEEPGEGIARIRAEGCNGVVICVPQIGEARRADVTAGAV